MGANIVVEWARGPKVRRWVSSTVYKLVVNHVVTLTQCVLIFSFSLFHSAPSMTIVRIVKERMTIAAETGTMIEVCMYVGL